MNNITVILKYGKLVKIDKNLFVCNYKDWTVKFKDYKDQQFKALLYFKGIYLTVTIVEISMLFSKYYDILPGIIEKENSTLL